MCMLISQNFLFRKCVNWERNGNMSSNFYHMYIVTMILFLFHIARSLNGDTVLRFGFQKYTKQDAEVLNASLLVFVGRRRRRKKMSKGKIITIGISVFKGDNSTKPWQLVTLLRTRVRRRKWKRISLPVSIGQQLLSSKSRSLKLKVNCRGCGRLVKLGSSKQQSKYKNKYVKAGKRHVHVRYRVRTRKKQPRHRGSPLVVIRTRESVWMYIVYRDVQFLRPTSGRTKRPRHKNI